MLDDISKYEYEQGQKVGTYSEEMLKDLLYSDHEGYKEVIKIYRDRPLSIYNGFNPIVYQASIAGLYNCYNQYAEVRLFKDTDNFKMSDIISKKEYIKDYIKENLKEQLLNNKEDVDIKITILCYIEHLITLLFRGEIDKIQYHELDRLEMDTLMWGIDSQDKFAKVFVKENYDLLRQNFEYRGQLKNLGIYTRIMLSYFMEVKLLKTIVNEAVEELTELQEN